MDFTAPRSSPASQLQGEEERPTTFIPILQVHKERLVGFRLRSLSGDYVTTATERETRTIAVAALMTLADAILDLQDDCSLWSDLGGNGRPYPMVDLDFSSSKVDSADCSVLHRELIDLRRSLLTTVCETADAAESELRKFESAQVGLKAKLWASPTFRWFLHIFATHYILTIGVNYPTDVRTSIEVDLERSITVGTSPKITAMPHPQAGSGKNPFNLMRGFVDQTVEFVALRLSGILQTICWRPIEILQETHSAAWTESFHIEVKAPVGMNIVAVKWIIAPPVGAGDDPREIVRRDLGARPVDVYPLLAFDGADAARAKLARVPLGYSLVFVWKLLPLAQGWLSVAALLSMLMLGAQLLVGLPLVFQSTDWAQTIGGLLGVAVSTECPSTALVENRAALLLGVVGLGFTVFQEIRSRADAATVQLLLFPRFSMLVVVLNLLVLSSDLFGIQRIGNDSWFSLAVLLSSTVATAIVVGAWLVAVGPIRRRRRRSWDRSELSNSYWQASRRVG